MSRYYDQPIQMECDGEGTPVRFLWRETTYRVRAVLARWHLRDRWWAIETSETSKAKGSASATHRADAATDRFYWRLHCTSEQTAMVFCVVYHDAAVGMWRLDRVYD